MSDLDSILARIEQGQTTVDDAQVVRARLAELERWSAAWKSLARKKNAAFELADMCVGLEQERAETAERELAELERELKAATAQHICCYCAEWADGDDIGTCVCTGHGEYHDTKATDRCGDWKPCREYPVPSMVERLQTAERECGNIHQKYEALLASDTHVREDRAIIRAKLETAERELAAEREQHATTMKWVRYVIDGDTKQIAELERIVYPCGKPEYRPESPQP